MGDEMTDASFRASPELKPNRWQPNERSVLAAFSCNLITRNARSLQIGCCSRYVLESRISNATHYNLAIGQQDGQVARNDIAVRRASGERQSDLK